MNTRVAFWLCMFWVLIIAVDTFNIGYQLGLRHR